jgi:hypothetical protein
MGWCIDCHREQAHLPNSGLQRSWAALAQKPKPAAGMDCAICHY